MSAATYSLGAQARALADQYDRAFGAAYDRIAELEAALERVRNPRHGGGDVCGHHTITGDLTCLQPPGHVGSHRGGYPEVAWTVSREDREPVDATILCGRRGSFADGWHADCERPDGHLGAHVGPVSWTT